MLLCGGRLWWVDKRLYFGLLTAILLVAAVLRFCALPDFPYGVAHDEVAEVLIAEGILQGHHAVFFREAYGQEPLFLYLVAGAMVFLGRNVLALRFVTAAVGLLTVAAGARLARRLWGVYAALITAAGLSGMLWPVFWSRVGLRGMTLPLVMCLGAEALWRALRARANVARFAVMSGVWWGLSAYTYLASRGVPLLYGAFLLYVALFDRKLLRHRWRELLIVLGIGLVIALPLILFVSGNKDVQFRVYEVNAPLQALRQGDPGPVWENVRRVAGMFSVQGDPIERNNFPDRPVFPEPVWALLFYAGLIIALLHLRDARHGFVLIWLGVMLSPTVVTVDAPSFVRALGALPAVMLLPGVGATWYIQRCSRLSKWMQVVFVGVLSAVFALNVGLTVYDYSVRWPLIPSGQFVWQADLVDIARWVDDHPDVSDLTVAGLSNDTMDSPSFDLLLRRTDVQVRWVDTGSPLGTGGAWLVPRNGGQLYAPAIVPVNTLLRDRLVAWGATVTAHARFTEFVTLPILATTRVQVNFEGNAGLVALDVPEQSFIPGAVVTAFSVWEAGDGSHPPFKVFVHLVDGEGRLWAQHDGLDSPAQFWQPGDRVVQVHTFTIPTDAPPGVYRLRVGLYDPETLSPYMTKDGQDFFEAATIQVQA